MRKIVCLATSPWYPIPTRKQQVMSRIPDAEILYFDPSITFIAPMKDKAAQPGLTNYKKAGVHPQENITVYALPPVLPFFYKFRWINKLNQQKIARFVRKKMREHGFEDAVCGSIRPSQPILSIWSRIRRWSTTASTGIRPTADSWTRRSSTRWSWSLRKSGSRLCHR